ncbi:hypothetical protein ACLOJK_018774 [Asimina triloba]
MADTIRAPFKQATWAALFNSSGHAQPIHAPTDGVLHSSSKSSAIGDKGRSTATHLHLQQLRPLDGCVTMNTATMAARSGDPSSRIDHSSKTHVLPTAQASASAPIGR